MEQSLNDFEFEECPIHNGNGLSLSQQALRELRKARLENQTRFWARFGVTQSRGSRFEMGMEIPPPVSILLNLYLNGVVSDQDLDVAIAGDSIEIVPQISLGNLVRQSR
jgi:hypothetical protein